MLPLAALALLLLALATLGLPTLILFIGLAFIPKDTPHWNIPTLAARTRAARPALTLVFGLILIEILQSQTDAPLTRLIHTDYTPWFAHLEHGWHRPLQDALATPPLTFLLLAAYLIGFPLLLYGTPILLAWRNKPQAAHDAALAYALCYAIALPFYLFFPVQEAWTTGEARNLLLTLPHTDTLVYAFNEVNNAFPSLHAAMSIAVTSVAWRSGERAYARFAAATATLVLVSTIYLGIHWWTDLAAGVLLGAAVGAALARRRRP